MLLYTAESEIIFNQISYVETAYIFYVKNTI